jgi:uncharacterized protein YkwD
VRERRNTVRLVWLAVCLMGAGAGACDEPATQDLVVLGGQTTVSTSKTTSAKTTSAKATTEDDASSQPVVEPARWDEQAEAGNVDPTYEALAAINAVRSSAGLGQLVVNKLLGKAAQAHATFVAQNFSLYAEEGMSIYVEPADGLGATGGTPIDRIATAGYTGVFSAELIAFKHTPTAAVHGWLETLYQRLRILDPEVSEMGLGWSEVSGYTLHIVELGSP